MNSLLTAIVVCAIPVFISWPGLFNYGTATGNGCNFTHVTGKSLLVPGGGYLGYFWSMGYLDANSDSEEDYFCYSSGCFAVFAHLLHEDVENGMDMYKDLQKEWFDGSLSRFDILGKVTDQIFEKTGVAEMGDDERRWVLGRINVMLTGKDLRLVIKKAETFEELKSLALQSSWLPGITGNSLFLDGYIDGYISILGHPTFERRVPSFPFISGLRVSTHHSEAMEMYEKGRLAQ